MILGNFWFIEFNFLQFEIKKFISEQYLLNNQNTDPMKICVLSYPGIKSTFFPARLRFSSTNFSSHKLEITAEIFGFCSAHR
jgi:hypothetical protein